MYPHSATLSVNKTESQLPRNGFALVIALSLMSFVLLLILSLVTFVQVESRASSDSKERLAARQNALLGAYIALGRLQQQMGPDQRATASGGLLTNGNYYSTDEGLSRVPSSTSVMPNNHWVGAWGPNTFNPNRDASESVDHDFQGWLVSGGNRHSLDFISTAPGTNSYGQGAAVLFDLPLDNTSVTELERESLQVTAEVEPVFTGASDAVVGGFAYWISDESMKAKLNLNSLDAYDTANAGTWGQINSASIAIQPNAAMIGSGLNDGPFAELASSDALARGKLHFPDDVKIIIKGERHDEIDQYKHDYTFVGEGLIVDAQNGGLKYDLTAGLGDVDHYVEDLYGRPVFWFSRAPEIGNLPSATKDALNYPHSFNADYLFHYYTLPQLINDKGTNSESYEIQPRRQYARDTATIADRAALGYRWNKTDWPDYSGRSLVFPASPQNRPWESTFYENNNSAASYDHHGETFPAIGPIILRAQVTYSLEAYRYNDGPDDTIADDDSYGLRIHYQPAFVLYNPYNITIELDYTQSTELDNVFRMLRAPSFDIRIYDQDGNEKFINQLHAGGPLARFNQPLNSSGDPHWLRDASETLLGGFQTTLAPGEIQVFSPKIDSGAAIPMGDIVNESKHPVIPMTNGFRTTESAYVEEIYLDLDKDDEYDDYPLSPSVATLGAGFLTEAILNEYGQSNYKQASDLNFLKWPPEYNDTTPGMPYLQESDTVEVFINFNQRYGAGYRFGYSRDPNSFQNWSIIHDFEAIAQDSQNTTDAQGFIPPQPVANLIGSPRAIGAVILKVKPAAEDALESDPTLSFEATLDPVRVLSDYNIRVLRDNARTSPEIDGNLHTMIASEFVIGDRDTSIQHGPGQGGDNDTNGYWGEGISYSSGSTNINLFEIPRTPLLSIGQFQHVNMGTRAHEPTFAIGNAIRPPWLPADKTLTTHSNNMRPDAPSYIAGSTDWLQVDVSYYANDALFDEFFFSSVPVENLPAEYFFENEDFDQDYIDQGKPLPSSRMKIETSTGSGSVSVDSLRDPEKAAAFLRMDGSFNVNSTSVEAWKAQLSSIRNQSFKDAGGTETTAPIDYPVARLKLPYLSTGMNLNSDLDRVERWNGVADFSESEIEALARNIVEEIKIRGPFLSIAEFVNRNLVAESSDPEYTNYAGTLQAAIDNSGMNSDFQSDATGLVPSGSDDSYARNATTWISQADLLSILAPSICVRGDTFVIRSYGESQNSITSATSRALLEMVVQRKTDYVDPENDAWVQPYVRSGATDTYGNPEYIANEDMSVLNQRFGRKFEILSIRWMAPLADL